MQVSVAVHKVDTEQFLTFRTAEAWQALAHRSAALVYTVGSILALCSLTGAPGGRWDLTELSAERKRHRSERAEPNEAEGISPPVWFRNSLTTPGKWAVKVTEDGFCECCCPKELSPGGPPGVAAVVPPRHFPEKEVPPQPLFNKTLDD